VEFAENSEFWRSFSICYPWGWDISWCQIADTEKASSSRCGVFKRMYECIICSTILAF